MQSKSATGGKTMPASDRGNQHESSSSGLGVVEKDAVAAKSKVSKV